MFCNKKIKKAYDNGITDGMSRCRQNIDKDKKRFATVQALQMIGKKVIVISNEWDNPVVGVVVDVDYITKAQTPVLIVKDYVTNTEVMPLGITKLYTKQKLEAILSLDPFALIALLYDCYDGTDDFKKPKYGDRWENEKIFAALKENGFYDVA